jgi:hypothetical protein
MPGSQGGGGRPRVLTKSFYRMQNFMGCGRFDTTSASCPGTRQALSPARPVVTQRPRLRPLGGNSR